jgi:TRAP-type mannitol/chloroaromatic compound transport system substrate-binding protein
MEDLDALDKLKKYGTKIRKFSPEIQNYMLNKYIDLYENDYAKNNKLFKKVWEHQKAFLARYLPYVDLQTTDWEGKADFYKLIGAKTYVVE